MTRADILASVDNLRLVAQTNPTTSGMKIAIGAIRDLALEAQKICDFDLRNELLSLAADLGAALVERKKNHE